MCYETCVNSSSTCSGGGGGGRGGGGTTSSHQLIIVVMVRAYSARGAFITLAIFPLDDTNVMDWQIASPDRTHFGWRKDWVT
jgi:hypothetical protein